MSFVKTFDIGWLYLLCGLALAISAIVLPSHQDLHDLKERQSVIQADLDDLEYQVELYREFLMDMENDNPVFQQRLVEMQFNKTTTGTAIVIDSSASQTPLQWIAQRARRDREISTQTAKSSLLTGLSSGRSRLLLVGAAAFAMFIGLLKSITSERNNE